MILEFASKESESKIFSLLSSTKEKLPVLDDHVLIKGDNLKVLYLLLENYRGKIDLVYIDPPFNTNQSFYSENGRSNSISNSKFNKVAYNDDLPREQFLEFIRERLILIRELLSPEGSIYLHIDYKVGHYVKVIMDEIFGDDCFVNDITRIKSNPKNFNRKAYGNEKDLILFYAKKKYNNIWNNVMEKIDDEKIVKRFASIDENGRRFTTIPLHAPGQSKDGPTSKPWRGMDPPAGRHWRTSPEEFDKLDAIGKIYWSSNGNPRIKFYADEHKGIKIQDVWTYKDPQSPVYPTEKNIDMIKMIISQSSRMDSIVMDCFVGGGTTLKAANMLGRKWIGIDQSDISIETIKKTLDASYQFVDIENLDNNVMISKSVVSKKLV